MSIIMVEVTLGPSGCISKDGNFECHLIIHKIEFKE